LNWPPEIRRGEGLEVFSVDLPGHGESGSQGENSIRAFAERLVEWMDSLNLEQAIVCGHSMGGAIAMTMGLLAPDRVTGLVLISTGAKLRVHPKILTLTSEPGTFHAAAELVTTWSFSKSVDERLRDLAMERMKEIIPEVAHSDFIACDNFDLMEQLGEIHTPTLVICGEEDLMTPVKFSRYLADQIKGASLYLLPDAGHMAMLERPREVADRIMEFVREMSTDQ
jgi:pimeloyl-ACP methyl ester carboxylesterase